MNASIWAMPCSVLTVDDHPGFIAKSELTARTLRAVPEGTRR